MHKQYPLYCQYKAMQPIILEGWGEDKQKNYFIFLIGITISIGFIANK